MTVTASKNGTPTSSSSSKTITVPKIEQQMFVLKIVGTTPLVANRFGASQFDQMLNKQTGENVKTRERKVVEQAARESMWLTDDDKPAHPAAAFRIAILQSHMKGAPMTKKALEQGFLIPGELIPITARETRTRTDALKNANGGADIRCRVEYLDWECEVPFIVYPAILSAQQLVAMLARAGAHVGIGPQYMRVAFGYGRFTVASIQQ
jgi:hypothetical protein